MHITHCIPDLVLSRETRHNKALRFITHTVLHSCAHEANICYHW